MNPDVNRLHTAAIRYAATMDAVQDCSHNEKWGAVLQAFHEAEVEIRAACRSYVASLRISGDIKATQSHPSTPG